MKNIFLDDMKHNVKLVKNPPCPDLLPNKFA